MRALIFRLMMVFCLLFVQIALAEPESPPSSLLPQTHANPSTLIVPKAPTVDATTYVLIDAMSGKILAQKDANNRMPPASLTKMMTLYIVSQALASGHIHLEDEVTISQHAWRTSGSKMFVNAGQRVTVADLVKGIVVSSGNDACIALAEYVAGSEEAFVSMMNQQAQILQMKDSHFTDCTGMPNQDHYTTAADLAILARALVNDYPEYYKEWYGLKWFSFNNIKQPNRNRLLWRTDYVDGIKTGHTDEAGFCLVASGEQNHMRLISVVMGSTSDENRTNASHALLAYGFRFYETHKLYSAGNTIKNPRVWMGTQKTVALGITNDVYVTTPIDQYRNLNAVVSLKPNLQAPVTKGQTLGELTVKLEDEIITQVPLLALEDVSRGGFFTRVKDYIGHTMHNLLHHDKAETV